MASPTTPASTSAAPAPQGTIVFVQGEAYLRDRQGKLQAIKPGDAVAEGQEIVTTAGALVDVQLPSGAKLSVGPDRQVLLNDELFATAAPEPTENVVSSLGADADKVIQALNTGGDPFAGLEDPAAGLTGGGNSDQTHNFVRLVRILEDVTPLAFNYTSSSDGIDFLPVSSVPAQPTTTVTNQPPVATDDPAFTTREDEATTVTVLTNDSDPDGDPISVTRASAPNGTVTLNPDGTLRYVPNPDFNGTDTITYTISDGKGGTATATVTVNVTPVNDPPVARPDTATTNEDTPVTIPVLGNDSDVDGDPLTVTGATVNPAQGSVVINPDGTLSFTPAPNFNGPAQITYTIEDGRGGTTTAVVTVEVAPVNDVPVARNDVDGLVKTDTVPATGNLITNPAGLDTDLEGDTLTVSAIGSAPVTGATVISGLFGTLTIQPNGEYSYAQDVTNPAIVALAPGDTLQDRFTYTVSDGKGGTATATLTLNIAGANTPPVAQPDSVTTDEDTPVTFPVLGNDSDPEGDPLTVTGATVNPAQGSVVINPDGTLSFTPAPNFNGPAQITYTIEDGRGGTTTALVTVEVAPVNDAPVARNDSGRVEEDATLVVELDNGLIASAGNAAGKDTDIEGDPLTVTALRTGTEAGSGTTGTVGSPLSGAYGSLTVNPQGSYTYVADRATALAAGKTATDTFTYTISDGKGGTDTAELVITITGTNDTPVQVGTLPGVSGTDARSVTIPTAAGFADPDSGDTLTFTATGLPPGLSIDPASGLITGTLASDASVGGPYPITVTVTDGSGAQASQTFNLSVGNPAPIASPDTLALTENDTQGGNVLTGSGLGGDKADTDPDGDTLVVTRVGTGSTPDTDVTATGTVITGLHGNLTLKADGSYTYTATDDRLAASATATDTFTYTISDAQGGTSTTTLTVTVTGTNDAPAVLATSANVSEEGLAGGEADTLGTIDTTDAVSHSGIINLSDADGDTLSVTLSAPADSISSAGVPIVWSGSGTHTLIGSAGGVEIIRATVGDDGRYTVTLSGAIDHPNTGEDARSLGLGVNVSDGTTTVQSTLTITVEDDAPQVAEIKQTIEVAPIDTNLLLILDTSGSMNTGDGVAGTSRLATAISALNQLLDSYDNFGEVRVRLVTFSDSASSRGSGWMAVSEAKALLAALTPSGGTNYDAALATAQSAFGTAGKLASGQNIAYFLSDGQPSFTQWAIDTNEESAWKSFLSTNDITSYALGMGSRTAQGDLNPIAYNGTTNTDLDGQVITDFNKLAGALQTTIPPTASGEILSGSLHGTGFGGDGGHVSSITVDGVTYTPDTSLGTLTASGGTSTATYDATTNSIRVLTATSGTLALDFDTGSYTYTPPPSVSTSVINDGFTYVLTDNDGDSASSRVLFTASRMNENTITLSSPQQVSGTSGNDSITGSSGNDSVSGGAGNDVIKGGDGDDLIAGGAGHDTLTGGAGADTFKWSLGEAGTTAAPAVDAITDFNTAASTGVDVLDLRDLLQGESHTGNLAGNLGSYLHFEKIGADTVVNVSSNGGFSGGNYSATDQKLILQGVDLTTLGTDTQIIQNLLANGKLNTD